MKVDKYSIMEILRERGCHSFDEDNYHLMEVSLIIQPVIYEDDIFDKTERKLIKMLEIKIYANTYSKFSAHVKEHILYSEYVKKSRDSRIDRILCDI